MHMVWSFNEHLGDITRKSYRTLGFISRQHAPFVFISVLFKCSELILHQWQRSIARIQKKFSRMLYFKFRNSHPRPPYNLRLNHLNLHSLESHCLENDEIMSFKLIHNHVDSSLRQRISLHSSSI